VSLGALALLLAQGTGIGVPAPDPLPAPPTSDSSDAADTAPSTARKPNATEPTESAAAVTAPVSEQATVNRAASPAVRAEPDHVGTSLKASAGAYYQQLYDVPIVGGLLSIAVGPFRRNRTAYLALELDHGNTSRGLPTWGGRLTIAPDWAFDRFRVGFAAGAGYLQVERVTNNRELTSFTILCGELHASVDLANVSDSGAFYLVAAFHADLHLPLVWGPSAALGYRTDSL
jgi:hypothetical protein